MSKQLVQFPSGVILHPDHIKPLIQSLQEVCTVRNIDFRTVGTAKAQHIMAEALGFPNWQHLLARCTNSTEESSKQVNQEAIQTSRFVLTEEEKALLRHSSTGRWVIEEVQLFNECWNWLKTVQGYVNEVWYIESLPAEKLPHRPPEMLLKSLTVTATGVQLEIGEKPKFTLELAVNICEEMRVDAPLLDAIEASHGILTFHTWTAYSMALPIGEHLDNVIKTYGQEIADALEDPDDR
ncbi:hypothetical protein [Marinobacter mobilis]|uniref:hypothetical protein n=1 Tax=Marinobacter mobilis TaxID=488533 RepID=UPI0035C674EA